ncbi:MAG: PIG-L family deacetylase [Candidatus Didemnitutus sp.]|nr:PIG-L family deacetylase [Candidatus Didemnitutus sp.]
MNCVRHRRSGLWWVALMALGVSVVLARGASSAASTTGAEQPAKAALMVVIAHPDDEAYFPGLLPYVCLVRKLPVVFVVLTSGEAGITPAGNRELREEEQRRACRVYGLPNEPVFARFADGAWQGTLEDNWKLWGGESRAAEWLAAQIRHYRPDVVVTHALDGESGHPNHVGCALSVTKACAWAADATRGGTEVTAAWSVKKLYVHRWPTRPLEFRQDVLVPGTDRTCLQIGEAGGKMHRSQGYAEQPFAELDAPGASRFGLYATTVGVDSGVGDLFEHVDLAPYRKSAVEPPDGADAARQK